MGSVPGQMTTLVDRPSGPQPLDAPVESPQRPIVPPWIVASAAAAVAAGVVLRFVLKSHLWLDETLSVDIARLPIGKIPAALRHDGAPPLYYLLLHGWMRLFGTGDVAVRALSGVASVAALPLIHRAGKRISGGDGRVAA